MGKHYICFLILQNAGFFRNCHRCFLCVSGYHYNLDTRAVQHAHSLNRIGSHVVSQAEYRHQNFPVSLKLRDRQKFHRPFCLLVHLFFYFCFLSRRKFLCLPLFCKVVGNFVNHILRRALPVNRPVLQLYCRALLLRIKTADFFHLRTVRRIGSAVRYGIRQQRPVHIIAADCFAF